MNKYPVTPPPTFGRYLARLWTNRYVDLEFSAIGWHDSTVSYEGAVTHWFEIPS